jgi:hypothetical protein
MCFKDGLKGDTIDVNSPSHPVSITKETEKSSTAAPQPQSQPRKSSRLPSFDRSYKPTDPNAPQAHKHKESVPGDGYEDHLVAGFHSYGPKKRADGSIITGDDDPDERRTPSGGLSPRELRDVEYNYVALHGVGGVPFSGAGFGMPGSGGV